MTVFVQTAENGGILFNNRRVSRDSAICEKILSMTDGKLYINEKSASLFPEDRTIIKENIFSECPENGFLFAEYTGIGEYSDKISKLVIFNFSRDYPADFYLDFSPEKSGWVLSETEEFCGTSHEKITMEIWTR